MLRILFCLMVLVSTAGAACAEEYGAIAYDANSGSWGSSIDEPALSAANSVAIQHCFENQNALGDCQSLIWFQGNRCGALAVGPAGSGWDAGRTRQTAETGALRECAGNGSACSVLATACNSQESEGTPSASSSCPPAPVFTVGLGFTHKGYFCRAHPGCPYYFSGGYFHC
jgi:hypothetical protein